MADRVIVVVRGRLAAAGGHRRSATPWTTSPATCSCGSGRPTAGQRPARQRGRVGHQRRRRRPRHLHHAGQGARRAPPPGRARTSACTSSRSARSTTRSRACSGSSCDDRHRHDRSSARPAIVALVVYTLQACLPGKRWIGALVPASAAVLFGFIASTIDDTAAPGVRGRGRGLPVRPRDAGDLPGHRRRRARARRCARARSRSRGCHRCPRGRSPSLAGSGGSLASAACARDRARRGRAGDAGEPASTAAIARGRRREAYVAVFLAIGCITRRAAVWSLAFVFIVERLLGANLSGIAQLSPSWEARAAFVGLSDVPGVPRPRGHPPRHRRHRPPRPRHGRGPRRGDLAHGPHAPLGAVGLTRNCRSDDQTGERRLASPSSERRRSSR